MLKTSDLDKNEILKSQLKTLKNKPTNPIKFIKPPKDILECLVIANRQKNRQLSVTRDLRAQLNDPDCTNRNSLNLQINLMHKSTDKLSSNLCAIIQHLVAHKFPGISLVGRYTHQNQPRAHNWYEVAILGESLFLCLSDKIVDKDSVKYVGIYRPDKHVGFTKQVNSKTDFFPSEAVSILENFYLQLMLNRAKVKDANRRINNHNKTVKTLKQRIACGQVTLIDDLSLVSKKYRSKKKFNSLV